MSFEGQIGVFLMNKIIFIFIFILIPNLSFSETMTSEDFDYSQIYVCSQKGYKYYGFLDDYEIMKYYFIHMDDHSNIVIL